jgi:hypothetical protein
MEQKIKSIRPFIGSKDFDVSRAFYRDLGFEETVLSPAMSVFKQQHIQFYLQDAYVKDWIDNTMIFIEVEDAEAYYHYLATLDLPAKYAGVRLSPVIYDDWGNECFLHDPCGILWHFGQFAKY